MSILKNEPAGSPEELLKTKLLAWPDSYYHERDPLTRKKLLEMAIDTMGETEADRIRKELWERRYALNDRKYTDSFLAAWMDLRFFAENGRGLFSGKNGLKLQKKLDAVGFDRLEDPDSLYGSLLYQELCQLAMLYMELCTEDTGYRSIAFGLGKMSDDALRAKIASDVKKVSTDLFKMYPLPEKYGLWKRALEDALDKAF